MMLSVATTRLQTPKIKSLFYRFLMYIVMFTELMTFFNRENLQIWCWCYNTILNII